ncbi:hypothetical protein B566_EDAN007845 [Ephemera danica]|nr:hypothetical protein B566_EDAN007845 [Ephemera danica]
MPRLFKKAIYLIQNTMECIMNKEMLDATESHIYELVSRPRMRLKSEIALIRAVVKWAHCEAKRRGWVQTDMRGVRRVLLPRIMPNMRLLALRRAVFLRGPYLVTVITQSRIVNQPGMNLKYLMLYNAVYNIEESSTKEVVRKLEPMAEPSGMNTATSRAQITNKEPNTNGGPGIDPSLCALQDCPRSGPHGIGRRSHQTWQGRDRCISHACQSPFLAPNLQDNSMGELTAKGSACSQEIGAPHEEGRTFSGSDSGTATRMKNTSRTAMAVARATTTLSLYVSSNQAPRAGDITMLAANVADTCNIQSPIELFDRLLSATPIVFNEQQGTTDEQHQGVDGHERNGCARKEDCNEQEEFAPPNVRQRSN